MRGIAVRLAGALAIGLSTVAWAGAEEAPRTASLTTAAKPLLRHAVIRFTISPQAWRGAHVAC